MTTGARRLGLRGRLLATVLLTIAFVLAALTAGFNIVLRARLTADANGVANARATAELAALRLQGGHILLPDAPDQGSPDSSIWVFHYGASPPATIKAIEAPQTPPITLRVAARAAAAAPTSRVTDRPALRLRALAVQQNGHRIGAVVAAVSLAPYNQTGRTALVGSAVLAVVAFAAIGLACRWLIGHALLPVATMTKQAAEWSEHDIDRRFNLESTRDEIGQLATTLDALLGRLAAGLRHEQRLSAELSHELRTPLAGIRAQSQYALLHTPQDLEGREALEEIVAATTRMTTTLDTLIAAARTELRPRGAHCDAVLAAREAAGAAAALAAANAVTISVVPAPESAPVAVEQPLVERVLAPIIENACRYAHAQIRIEIRPTGATVQLTVGDDGPGLAPEQLEAVFQPGWQGSASTVAIAGAGLGLPLARRLARSAGGDVIAHHIRLGGRFTVTLPAAGSGGSLTCRP